MMGLTNFLPPELQEIAKNAPKIIFRSIPLSQLMVEAAQTAKNMLDVEKQRKLKESIEPHLLSIGLNWVDDSAHHSGKLNFAQGETLLKLYFLQLKLGRRVFLDLRDGNFFQLKDSLGWKPSPLFHEFSVTFHEGILLLYEGFFLSDDSKMDQGLVQTGISNPSWDQTTRDTLRNLFKSHFGNAQTEAVTLNLDGFKKSFTNILEFLEKNQGKITVDFLYFGIYLISLYLSLDPIREPMPVKAIYNDVFGKSS